MKRAAKISRGNLISLAIIGSIIGLFWTWSHPRLSHQHTIDFAVQHQELLNEYVALARSNSPDAKAIEDQLLQYRYFTSVNSWFDKNGAIQIYFSVPDGGIEHNEEGHYQRHYCLVWSDRDFSRGGSPLLSFWYLLGEDDGIVTTQGGSWYCTSHKHWLYG